MSWHGTGSPSVMAGTMMACLEGMETEKVFLDVLKQVNRWKVTGQQLDCLTLLAILN